MEVKKPKLFVGLAKLTNVLHDGSEQAAGFSVRVSLRYDNTANPSGSIWDEFYDIPVRANEKGIFPDLEKASTVELIDYVLTNQPSNDKFLTTIEFSEQNIDGMIIRGQHHTWDQLTELGYKHQSQSFAPTPGGR
ncbi:hypothetical protein [Mesorhizobium sp. SP-1A]|uniref:hypothetical protein n=1 Tax=Mesorhizobium sp. SP-1A TaxID=3077840 RepID=UPI0028F7281A|nr:hypothetical protein [Mesorhizobium sp. SP-1A]